MKPDSESEIFETNIKNDLESNPHYLSGNPIDNQKWEIFEGGKG